jgi:hypothetical protein
MNGRKHCSDPDCIVCDPDPKPEPLEVEHFELVRWESPSTSMGDAIRWVVRVDPDSETPLITVAEEEVARSDYGAKRPVIEGRDVIVLGLSDAEWLLDALQAAIKKARES